jgi:outer membrane protein OmpA-like peptidoglycan-associated protein
MLIGQAAIRCTAKRADLAVKTVAGTYAEAVYVYHQFIPFDQGWATPVHEATPKAGTSTDKETMANMTNRDRSRTRGGAGRAVGVQLGMVVSAALSLGACSSVPDAVNPVEWYKSAEQAVFGSGQEVADAEAASGETDASVYTPPEIPGRNQPFPNLGDGPERPVVRTPAETGRLTEGLVADRARARHSERGIPLQGMSGERRAGLPTMADGEFPLGPETMAAASAPEVIRTQIGRPAPPRADGAAQAQGPTPPRGPSDPAAVRAQSTAPAQATGSVGAPGAAVATTAPRQANGTPTRMTFSDAPPPAAGGSRSASPPPPRPTFSDVAPPTLGLSSAPPPRQQPTVAEPPVTALADLPPPPPPGSAAPGRNEAPAPRSGAPAAPHEGIEVPEALVEEDDAQGAPADPTADTMAALGQAPDQSADDAAEPARSERIATIQFGRETAELGQPEREILRQVAALHQQRGGMIRVVGHGDSAAEDESAQGDTMNEQISLERANTVAQELIRLGVSRQEIRAVALTGSTLAAEDSAPAAEIYFVY